MHRTAGYNFVRARLGIADLPPRVAGQYNEFRNINTSADAQSGPTSVGEARYTIASAATYKQSCPEQVLQVKDEPTRLASCRFIAIFQAMSDALKARGTKLIVLLQPDGDILLEPAISYLRSKRERIAAFPVSQQRPYGIDMDFYWAADDTHWLPRGAELAADMIVAESQENSSAALLEARHPAIAAYMRELIAK
jgi:hypothetical protein